MKKDFDTRQKEILQKDSSSVQEQDLLPLSNEIYDNFLGQQHQQSVQFRKVSQLLRKIIEAQHNELKGCRDDLPISFERVEMEIAKYISGCLLDVPEQKRDISYILSLVKDYKVVVPVRGQNPTVSLDKVYTIVQDNYEGSSLCNLMNIMIGGFQNVLPKVITFF